MHLFYYNEEEMPVGADVTGEYVGQTECQTQQTPLQSEGAPDVDTDSVAEVATREGTPETNADSVAEVAISEGTTEADADSVAEVASDGQENTQEATTEEDAMGISGATYAPENSIPTLGRGENVLSVRHLFKGYRKDAYVLNNFSLDVAYGQIVGLLGPNGCGKTTLLKMIAGLLVPDSGSIEVAGEARCENTNKYISYLPERTYFTPGMKVSALLDYFEDFYDDFNRTLAEDMLADLDIPMNAKLRALSKGMKEKVQLVLVMSRKTKLYLLDEPIGGVDPAAREYVLNTILSRYNTEASVIITTHLIADIEPVLDSFAFLGYGGELLAYGSAEDARAETGKSLDELFREVFRCYRRL